MKGATHDLVVRTRTDVALYVLNHKRGHLRDLENSFKVSLSVIADPTVSGQQSYVIDRGEQVHTLEAAKALLAAQAAASPSQTEEVFEDEEEPFDAEMESEVETEETEGLSGEAAADGETASEGPRRRRRRRRRSRGGNGEAREGGMPREENAFAQEAVAQESVAPADAEIGDEDETDEDETGEQASQARSDQPGGGERRPRRRGRRGGRRRRGGAEEGLAGSITDELGPVQTSEVAGAVADFDEVTSQPSTTATEHEAPAVEGPGAMQGPASPAPESEAHATEADKSARRRSTVREKVSFASHSPSEPNGTAHSQPEPSASAETPAEAAAPEATTEAAPRRAGWWSRRFGGG